MNFLLHRHLAAMELASPAAGVGAMLPDLWRLAHRRVRARSQLQAQAETGELERGIVHHLEADRWFHEGAVFMEGERRLASALRAASAAPKLGLFAHASFEMCLDGALLRRAPLAGAADAMRADLGVVGADVACSAARAHGAERLDADARGAFESNMMRLWSALGSEEFLAGYVSGRGLCARLERLRMRFGLPSFSDEERAWISGALDAELVDATSALERLLDERAHAH